MSKRITVVLSDDIVKKARMLQSKLITQSNSSVSFSSVTNMLLKEGLLHYKPSKSPKS